MFALLETNGGEDSVSLSLHRNRLESKAIESIFLHIESWDNFPKTDECYKLLLATLNNKDVEIAMDLFSEMTSLLGNCIWLRIVPAELEYDA